MSDSIITYDGHRRNFNTLMTSSTPFRGNLKRKLKPMQSLRARYKSWRARSEIKVPYYKNWRRSFRVKRKPRRR